MRQFRPSDSTMPYPVGPAAAGSTPSTRNTNRRAGDSLIAKSVKRGTFWCQLFMLTVCVLRARFSSCRCMRSSHACLINLVRANRRLDFALVNVEIRVHVLYVVVLFQSFDQAQHL